MKHGISDSTRRRLMLIGLLLLFMLLFSETLAQQQRIEKCAAPKSTGGKYKLLLEARTVVSPYELVLDIAVEPKNFTAGYMRRVAERLRAEYCRENHLSVAIFDSKKHQIGWHYDFIVTGGKVDRRRGTYLFDREKMIDNIEFSTRPTNPINEIKIDLSKPVSVL